MEAILFRESDLKDEIIRDIPNDKSLIILHTSKRDQSDCVSLFPGEIWNIILSHLDIETYLSLPLVCYYFYHTIREKIIGPNGNYRIAILENKNPLIFHKSCRVISSPINAKKSLFDYFINIFRNTERILFFIIKSYKDLIMLKNITTRIIHSAYFECVAVLRSNILFNTRNNMIIDYYADVADNSFIYSIIIFTIKDYVRVKGEYVEWNKCPELIKEIKRISCFLPISVDITSDKKRLYIKRVDK